MAEKSLRKVLTDQEIEALRRMGENTRKEREKWEKLNRLIKWLVFLSVVIPAAVVFYCVRFV